MEYSLLEEMLLGASGVVIDLYHWMRDRPKTFWGAWVASFVVMAILLLRPRVQRQEDILTADPESRVQS